MHMTRTELVANHLASATSMDLDGVDFVKQYSIEQIAEDFNGIGPEWMPSEWREQLDHVFADFQPAAMIHDIRWSHSDGSDEFFTMSNGELGSNCRKIADSLYPWWRLRRYVRRHEADLFAAVCERFGRPAYDEAFRKQKTNEENSKCEN